MKKQDVVDAVDAAERFLRLAGEAFEREESNELRSLGFAYNSREAGALRRASLDLSQALVRMRNARP